MPNGKYLKQEGEVIYPYTLAKNVLDLYPIGSIYLSTININPADYFGGTWEQIQNRFLLGAGSSYTAGSTGGAATVTLTTNQMPSHQHTLQLKSKGTSTWSTAQAYTLFSAGSGRTSFNWDEGTANADSRISPTGGGQAHENMPPYLVVYMWKRTA